MPRITVWFTSYNHEKFIEKSIQSVLNQTYRDFELIIVDDGSSDNSWDIIQYYAKGDNRIQTIRHETNWRDSGFRYVLPEMQGEYVAIAHSDDLWMPDKLEKQMKVLEQNPELPACFTLVKLIGDYGEEITYAQNPHYSFFEQKNRTRYEWLNYFFYHGNCLCHPSLLIRKEAYQKYDTLSRGLHGYPDFCQWVRLCMNADIFIIQEKLTCFRIHSSGGNTSGENEENIKRIYTEEVFLLKEYFRLIDMHKVCAVFPEAEQFRVNGKMNETYALAQIFLEGPRNSYKLLGLTLLYSLFQNDETKNEIEELYGYASKKFNCDKQRFDIFNMIPKNRILDISLYFDDEDGYGEDKKIVESVYIQSTGYFTVKMQLQNDLLNYSNKVRLDLGEGRYWKFKIIRCACNGVEVQRKPINGTSKDDWDVFYTTDPQYELAGVHQGVFEVSAYVEEIPSLEIDRLLSDYNNIRNELSDIKKEKPWKIKKRIIGLLNR